MTEVTEINYKKIHKERKQTVLDLLKKAQDHFTTYSNESKVQAFQTLYKNIEEGEFSIVVVGEFSAGKSTFLNALMHDKFLPSFSNETTATINFLKHKDKSENNKEVAIYYKDPTKETDYTDASIENIKQFVSTESNINVADDIDRVELFLGSKFLKDGVMLVDSPGLNGVAEGHKEITEQQIEKSHACIFMFSAEQPGRKTDFEFLTKLMAKVDTVLLVLNKIDVIKENEQTVEDVMQTLTSNYHTYFPDKKIPEIWPIAAYPALVSRSEQYLDYHGKTEHSAMEKQNYLTYSRVNEFEARLWKFLTQGEKNKQELLAPVDRVKKILIARKNELIEKVDELENVTDTEEIKLEIAKIEEDIANIEETLDGSKQEIRSEIGNLIKEMKENLKSKTQDLKRRNNDEVSEWSDLNNLDKDIEHFNKKLTTSYQTVAYEVYQEFIEEFEELLKVRFSAYANEFDKVFSEKEIDNEIKLNVKGTLDTEQFELNFGLEDYRSKIEGYEQEITKLEEKSDQAFEDRAKAERLELDKEELQEKIESLHRREESFHAILGPRPSIKKYEETRQEGTWRGGLVGLVGNALLGKKLQPKSVSITDDSEQENYDQEKHRIDEKMEQEQRSLEKQLQNVKGDDKGSDYYQLIQNKIQRSERKKREELDRLHQEYKEHFQQKHTSTLRRVRVELEEFIDQLQKEVEKEFYKKLKKQKNELTDIVIDVMSKNIKEKITDKKEELEIRMNQLDSSQEEKTAHISAYNKEREDIDKLLQEVIPVELELDSVETDKIEFVN